MNMKEEKLNPNFIVEEMWSHLEKSTKDRDHDFHSAVFTNLDKEGLPSSRTIILRNISKKNKKIVFHSDYRSPKIKEIEKNNKCLLLFYSPVLKIQLRIKVLSTIEYCNEISNTAWTNTKLMSRKCYLTSVAPGKIISNASDNLPDNLKGKEPEKLQSEKGYKNFSVVTNQVQSIDWLFLSSNGNKRILFDYSNNNNSFYWINP